MAPPPLDQRQPCAGADLWVTVAVERLGYPAETALTLGWFVAGFSPRAKVRRLGISDDNNVGFPLLDRFRPALPERGI